MLRLRYLIFLLAGIAVIVLSFSITLFMLQDRSDGPIAGVSFVVDPAIMRECDPPVIAKVSWDAAAANVQTVKIFILANKVETLFASTIVAGSVNTGEWVAANTVFVLRDGDSMKQLAKFSVGSKSCN